MENYTPNSHAYKEKQKKANTEERKKVEKVVSGTAKVKKKSSTRKFADVFISEDASNVKQYIFADVLVPAVKKLVSDIVKDGIEMILYGGTRRGDRGSDRFRSDYISYNKYSDRRDAPHRSESRSVYNYDNIFLETRGEAERVLTCMDELIQTYGQVTVADLFDLVGVTADFTANKYGWINLRNAEVVRTRDGYTLKLPRALPIEY